MSKNVSAIKIEEFVITIGDKVLELTPERAKELRDILINLIPINAKTDDDLYEEIRKIKEKQDKTIPVPYPVPYPQPYPIYPKPWRPWPYWEVWCNAPTAGYAQYTTCNITCKS
jgi:hypothetical protein